MKNKSTQTKSTPKNLIKKFVRLFLSACLILGLCSCKRTAYYDDGRLLIVCTSFSAYDWVCQLAGEDASNISIKYLGEKGVDMHSYQPSAEDMAMIKSCDLFIYTGGESESWVEDALREDANPDMLVINMLELTGENALIEEELPELTKGDRKQSEKQEYAEQEYDEHIWLSVKNAMQLVTEIEAALETLDAENSKKYRENYDVYMSRLTELEESYAETIENAENKTLIFGDRFPFRYLVNDYGLDYYAAFKGCSAETEAGFETITFLAGKLDELKIDYIIVIEGSDKRLAATISQSTKSGEKLVVEMDSIQSVSRDDMENGYTYIKAKENNLEVLRQVLY